MIEICGSKKEGRIMTDDIVARLRAPTEHEAWMWSVPYQAADEIERLREALKEERSYVISEVLFLVSGHLRYASTSALDDECLLKSIKALAGENIND